MYKNSVKIFFDFTASFIGLIILSPILIIISICLCISNKGNPFFFQKRPGKNGRIFEIIKFRTMNNRRDLNGNLLRDADRLTDFGSFVRRTSLDEMPQLINVLRGEMSIVGPRPLLPKYLHLYNQCQKRRNEVKPGITGWAQINGRNTISWDQKFTLDTWYVDHQDFLLDFKILLTTVKKVFISEGITQKGHVTSDEFEGNKR